VRSGAADAPDSATRTNDAREQQLQEQRNAATRANCLATDRRGGNPTAAGLRRLRTVGTGNGPPPAVTGPERGVGALAAMTRVGRP
jgi:hypothetical protein